MFGNELTFAEVMTVTVVGMGVVFFVLILLTGILSLFRFIPNMEEAPAVTTSPSATPSPVSSVNPLHKAIIVAAIFDNEDINEKKNYVRIKNIRRIS